ncbi:putative protein kinase RLK-Pelle-RKF3 family [Helianthus annuus]|nr:putative protein kinase RLK-Pelle-RKF3 family [Helianthus annuus]
MKCFYVLGIIHADLKPRNILLNNYKPMVVDFGLSRRNTNARFVVKTQLTGTHGYIAPEYQLWGRLTEYTDIFSYGVILYELLSHPHFPRVTGGPGVGYSDVVGVVIDKHTI